MHILAASLSYFCIKVSIKFIAAIAISFAQNFLFVSHDGI